jgi:branched-chain amino acid transport system substrate-binding protein
MKKNLSDRSKAFLRLFAIASVLVGASFPSVGQTSAPVYIAFDGAYGVKTNTAPKAIELGILAAIEEINARGGVLDGRPLKLLTSDNQGVSARARDNYLEHAARPDVVAVLTGKFSPLTVETVTAAHQVRVPLISVWGSADPITDHGRRPSFVFRLSLKDRWGVEALLRRARDMHRVQRVCAVLPNTAWGRSGNAVLQASAPRLDVTLAATRWYNWGDRSFGDVVEACRNAGAQAMVLVANEVEAALIVREIAQRPASERIPIVSHWGVTGGVIHELAGEALQAVDLQVIQTFTFIGNTRPRAQRLAAWLMRQGRLASEREIVSPVGSAHAYDMTHLLASAVHRAGSTQPDAVRRALERLPVFEGAVRDYAPAFTSERHDALGPEQVLFVRIERSGALMPLK